MLLFTDSSVNVQSKIGFGAYLVCEDDGQSLPFLSEQVKVKRFENTSSTKLELETLLWALQETGTEKVIAYTDSQNITGLPGRRGRFEKSDYRSRSGKQLKNHKLYREFFSVIDRIDLQLRQVKGHSPWSQKDPIDKIFALVDRASRNALRNSCQE